MGLHVHDLRGMAVTMLSEAENSVEEVASIANYSPTAAQKTVDSDLSKTRITIENAIARLERYPRSIAAERCEIIKPKDG